MENNNKIRLCDYIADYLWKAGVRDIFLLVGGGSSGLTDGFVKYGKFNFIHCHAENTLSQAVVAYSKYKNSLGVICTSTGICSLMAIPGLCDAFVDNVPVLFLCGEVNLKQSSKYQKDKFNIKLRSFGVQECNIIDSMAPLSKYTILLEDSNNIFYELSRCTYECLNDRMGPCVLSIPSDLQTKIIEINKLKKFEITTEYEQSKEYNTFFDFSKIKYDLQNYERPIILIGNGIHLSNTENQFRKFIEKYNVSFVTTYFGTDIIEYNHRLNIGVIGIKGSRTGNFALHNANFILVLGAKLDVTQIGYNYSFFAPEAKITVIDIDEQEHKKETIKISSFVKCDLRKFFEYFDA